MGKEPWKKSYAVNKISEEFLRLRHKLIPYMYSANYRTHKYGEPICMPMYYRYDVDEAYSAKNQYIFGGQLMVCPITAPTDKKLNLAAVDVWLPEGRWTDIFNGRIYEGGRIVKMYRDLDSIPVLAPAGAIVPMYKNDRSNELSLEQPLEIHIWRGNGHYEMYDDDGETCNFENGKFALTHFDLVENEGKLTLTITPPEQSNGVLPDEREIIVKFRDIIADDVVVMLKNDPVTIEIDNVKPMQNESYEELKNIILTRVQGANSWKEKNFKSKLPEFINSALSEFDALAK
jgi:alpha-glucosidase (family GH31 glycosyl hydrolase)